MKLKSEKCCIVPLFMEKNYNITRETTVTLTHLSNSFPEVNKMDESCQIMIFRKI